MVWLVALLAACACACGGADGINPDVATLKTRAAFDLNCPEDQVRGRWLDEKTMGVTACGQRATYVKICRSSGYGAMAALSEECQWLMNSESRPASRQRPQPEE
jgi:hypothetical protein